MEVLAQDVLKFHHLFQIVNVDADSTTYNNVTLQHDGHSKVRAFGKNGSDIQIRLWKGFKS
jgi:hypothetical protein